ncbi:hypothetical protein JVU11DRAFT_6509 [Chiua virens]|nr:hypothetical protein JVU11DRAFT_6509 [Chiua virens]
MAHTNPPVAWHRVIATSGIVSIDGPSAQQRLLEVEGIDVNTGLLGESRVTMEKWGWFPEANEIRFRGEPVEG